MLNVLNENNNLKFSTGFLTALLFGGELSGNNVQALNNTEQTSNQTGHQSDKQTEANESEMGDLELIYAQEGDKNYDSKLDSNSDSKISYKEYLRYCEQNMRMEEKRSDTKISEDRRKFTTYSFGHAANAYNKVELETPEGKVLLNNV